MIFQPNYSPREHFWLCVLAVIGFIVVNGAFICGVFFRQKGIMDALNNPIAIAFILEAFILLGILAYFLTKWQILRLHWGWFVFLSLLGSIAFALPVALLWRRDINTKT